MASPKDNQTAHHANAKALARTLYLDAVDCAAQVLKNAKAKPRDRLIASMVVVLAAEWDGEK